jgi:hypothetical protein
MRGNKEHQEICVVGRLFSLEALVFVMGVVSLVYGLLTGRLASIVVGALVLVVALLLARVWRRVRIK